MSCHLEERVNAATDAEIARKAEETRQIFDLSEDSPSDPLAKNLCARPTGVRAYRVAVGLDRLAEDFALDGLALLLPRRGRKYVRAIERGRNSGVLASLTARGIPCSGKKPTSKIARP